MAGSRWLRAPPGQRAGFSPLRYPFAVAQPKTFSMRPCNRLAVSGFATQMGFKILSTWSTVIWITAIFPMTGPA